MISTIVLYGITAAVLIISFLLDRRKTVEAGWRERLAEIPMGHPPRHGHHRTLHCFWRRNEK